jgi:hypothetical protein
MLPRPRSLLALLATLLLGVACSPDAERYSNIDVLVSEVERAAEKSCEDTPVEADSGSDPLYLQSVSCTLEGAGHTQFALFEDEQQRLRWAGAFRSLLGGRVVTGPNWGVTFSDIDVAEEVADSLGGTLSE